MIEVFVFLKKKGAVWEIPASDIGKSKLEKGDQMQDIEYLKSMYPSGIKILQGYVSEACDRLDYKNSPMYDEYPDQLMVNRLCDTICDTVMSSEGAERVSGMWNITEADRSSLEMEELHNDMKRLDIDSSDDDPDVVQDETLPEECYRIETESVRENQGLRNVNQEEPDADASNH